MRGELLHQEKIACLFDDPGNMALLDSGHAGDAARENLARISDVARQLLDIRVRELERVLQSWFLGCHKRPKKDEGKILGKENIQSCCRLFAGQTSISIQSTSLMRVLHFDS
jgi:hypothetical protein